MAFGERLQELRRSSGLTQEEFADLLGTTKQNISRYESGAVSPKISTAEVMAAKLGMTLSELNGSEESLSILPSNVRPISKLHHQRVPMIGSVAAGQPIYDPEDLGVYVESPVDADAAITIRGDSMIPNYQDGDLVYIKARPDVPEGAVAVVFLDDEATLKHVYKRPTGFTLISDNPAYPPIMAEFEDYACPRIFGVPVGYTRIYKNGMEGKIRKGFQK